MQGVEFSDRAERNNGNYLAAKSAFNTKDMARCISFYAEDHQIRSQNVGKGREHIERFLRALHDSWSDLEVVVEKAITSGDWLAGWCTVTATHSEPMWGIAPTYRQIRTTFWEMHHFNEGGKIAETWNLIDSLAILQQLGVVPPTNSRSR